MEDLDAMLKDLDLSHEWLIGEFVAGPATQSTEGWERLFYELWETGKNADRTFWALTVPQQGRICRVLRS